MNYCRKYPKKLAQKLKKIQTYLDQETNILSEPNKMQLQMVEGNNVFYEAINFLENLSPMEPLQWDNNLYLSAKEHVNDIGPKGLLIYQSSDGTEPEVRICKYGKYEGSLGENIDFGPNDAIGVIVSLTLDDGEEERPHRKNLFNQEYRKVGIACGPHKTEFHICVMDFASEFVPLEKSSNNNEELNIKKDNISIREKMVDLNKENNNLNKLLSEEKKKNEILLLEKNDLNKKLLEEKNKNEKLTSEKEMFLKQLLEERKKNEILLSEKNTLSEKYNNILLINKKKDEDIRKKSNEPNNLFEDKIKRLENLNVNLIENNLKKEKEIEELKSKISRYPFELNEGEEIFIIRFLTLDQKINYYSIICKNTDIFIKAEEKLFKEFPEYSDSEIIFTVNGKKVNKRKSLLENNIKNNDIVLLTIEYN